MPSEPGNKLWRYQYKRKGELVLITPPPPNPDHLRQAIQRAVYLAAKLELTAAPATRSRYVSGDAWSGPTRWLIDSGSAVHLVSQNDILKQWRSEIQVVDEPLTLATANGPLKANK